MMAEAEATQSYRAVALQLRCDAINACASRQDARAKMFAAIARIDDGIAGTLAWVGSDTRLIVLPEYFLTGFPMRESVAEWREKAALEMDGAEYEALGAIAAKHGIYLAGNAYEQDPNFPELFFQTSFIVDSSGDVILRYRRLNSLYSPTPHDVWTRYLEIYDLDAVFPVARTEIGALAAVASEEILFPEITRAMAMRGAEVIVHSSCEIASPLPTPKNIARRARAIENLVHVVSCNTAGMTGINMAGASADGGSAIIDYRGLVLAEAGAGESIGAAAEIDLTAQRRHRRRPGMENLLSRQRTELYAQSYSEISIYPPDSLREGAPERDHFRRAQQRTIERLSELGLI
jgi:predicted amidohydrolase